MGEAFLPHAEQCVGGVPANLLLNNWPGEPPRSSSMRLWSPSPKGSASLICRSVTLAKCFQQMRTSSRVNPRTCFCSKLKGHA